MFIAVGDNEYHNPNPEDWLHDIDMEAHLLYNRVVRLPMRVNPCRSGRSRR